MGKSDKFTKYNLATSKAPAFGALSVYAKALYPQLRLELRPGEFNNNGKVRFSVKQAAEFLGCNPETARKAFADLQKKGFLRVAKTAQLGVVGVATGHSYEITEEIMPGTNKPSMLFLEWTSEKEFDVVKARANNPTGRNGRRITQLTR